MRIELPSVSWADMAPRADDDSHTLTVAGQSASDWAPLQLQTDPALAVRTHVAPLEPLVLTLTF